MIKRHSALSTSACRHDSTLSCNLILETFVYTRALHTRTRLLGICIDLAYNVFLFFGFRGYQDLVIISSHPVVQIQADFVPQHHD